MSYNTYRLKHSLTRSFRPGWQMNDIAAIKSHVPQNKRAKKANPAFSVPGYIPAFLEKEYTHKYNLHNWYNLIINLEPFSNPEFTPAFANVWISKMPETIAIT